MNVKRMFILFKKNYKRILSVFLLCLLFTPMVVYAEPQVRSLIGDWKNGVLSKSHLSTKSLFEYSDEDKVNIANSGGNASLYDRFGDDISFIAYLGETKIQISLLDKIYTMAVGNSQKSAIGQIQDAIYMLFHEMDAGVNNVCYPSRADIQNNETDPRYRAYQQDMITAYNVGKANIRLQIANYAGALQRLFISDQLMAGFLDVYNELFGSDHFDELLFYSKTIIAILVCIFLLRIAALTYRVLAGKDSKKRIWYYTYNIFVTMLIFLMFAAAPLAFSNFYDDYLRFTNQLLTKSLQDISIDNAVVSGSEDIVDANLWYITIFDPWCKGTFGYDYDGCNISTYPLSNGSIGSASYDNPQASCTEMIGNIGVNSLSGEQQNLAALAYSCQSAYHIDTDNGIKGSQWPNAGRTTYNKKIYNDDLKWVDALMNISCEWIGPNLTSGAMMTNGDDSVRPYDYSNMAPYSWVALYRVFILLFPLTLVSITVIYYYIKMVLSFLRMVWYGARFMIDPDNQAVVPHLKMFLTSLLDYFFSIMVKIVIIMLFIQLYDGFLANLTFFLVALIFYFGSNSLTNAGRKLRWAIKDKLDRYKNSIERSLDEIKKEQSEDGDEAEDSDEDKESTDNKESEDEEDAGDEEDKKSDDEAGDEDERGYEQETPGDKESFDDRDEESIDDEDKDRDKEDKGSDD